MPCNESGFSDPHLFARFGIADFDWSNAKMAWSDAKPMDCEERLVTQAKLVKEVNPTAKTFVYRNLVKALPWYTSVREKITDPSYSGWFLPFSKNPPVNGTAWHMSKCTGNKCSDLYHDQEQTPQAPESTGPSRIQDGDWFVYNNTNDVSGCHPGWKTITDGGPQPTWGACRDAADKAEKKIFTWWKSKPSAVAGSCWLLSDWQTVTPQNYTMPGAEAAHVSGYKPATGEDPPPSLAKTQLCASGECDCGEGFPCGEYLWDHRNQSLRTWLINEFILGNETGLGNANVDGFYLDDGWTNKPSPVPSWAPPTYRQCDMAEHGGATEEDFFCTVDMGLSAEDVNDIKGNWSETIQQVHAAALRVNGFTWSQFLANGVFSMDLDDPRAKCATRLRQQCQPGNRWHESALMYEFTRKKFHDPFPLPYINEDTASFLLVRGPYAWLGFSWMGCNTADVAQYLRPKEMDMDYGEPIDDYCKETAPNSGVFVREWTKASVQMDCNGFKGTITMK